MKRKLIIISIILAVGIAYWLISPFWRVKVLDEEFPGLKKALEEAMMPETTILKSAALIPEAHGVKGKVLIVESGGQKFLRFEDLETINGPDLRIYLSAGLDVDDAIDLGPIKATRGNVNYLLPADADIEKYGNALIWCRAFRVLFSYGKFQ